MTYRTDTPVFVQFEAELPGITQRDRWAIERAGYAGRVVAYNPSAPDYVWGVDFGGTVLYFAPSELVGRTVR